MSPPASSDLHHESIVVIPPERGDHGDSRRRRVPLDALTVPEAIVGGVVLVVGAFAWMALLLIDNHVGTLPAVSVTAAGAVALAAGLLLFRRPTVRADPWATGIVVVLAIVSAVMFFPGFSYGAGDKDPGTYVELGAAFGRTDSYSFSDVLGQHVSRLAEQSPGARFPGIWLPHGTTVVPQFYHLWPSLLAMAYDIGGVRLEAQVAPLMGVIAVCAFALLLRRVVPAPASLPAAAIGGLLLVTNMMEVWQARYPSTEIMAQALFVTILLAICVSLDTGWRPAAGAAGLLLGVAWLERPDILVLVGIAAVAGAVLIALRRFDSRAAWFAAGFALVLPHALWQAYAGARTYTLSNSVPKLSTLSAGVVALAVGAVVGRVVRPVGEGIVRRLEDRSWQFWLGFALCVTAAGLMALGFLRPRLFGANMAVQGGRLVRTYNEQNMRRLSWFLTLAAFPLAGLGLAVVVLRRWRAAMWVAVLPALIVTPIYVDNARVASRLMWWVRRFVPEVLPGIILLVTIALTAALIWRFRQRRVLAIPALGAAAALLAVYLSQSVPLRNHNEYAGSFKITAEMAAVSGSSTGVYLFGQTACCTSPEYMFGAPLWLERNEYAALMPREAGAATAYVRRVVAAMPAHPVFLVWEGMSTPQLGSIGLTAVKHITTSIPMWEESDTSRPNEERAPIGFDFTIWRVTSTPPAA